MLVPLTGTGQVYGVAIRNGVSMAQKDHPDLFSDLQFIFEDSRYDNKTAVTAFNKLRLIDKVDLVYIFGHGQSHTVAPISESAKMPLVACTGEQGIADNRNYVIRFFVPHEWLGAELLKYLRARGYRHYGAVAGGFSFVQNILRGFRMQLQDGEKIDVLQEYPPEERDFRSSIAKLKRAKYDALGVFLGQGQVGVFFRQAKEARLSLPFFGTHAFETEEEIKQAQGKMEGAVFPAITVTDSFFRRYQKEFNSDTYISFAGNAYDFAVLTAKVLKDKPKAAPLDIFESFRTSGKREGVSGSFQYLESKDFGNGFIFPVAMKAIKSGKIVLVEEN